MTIFGSKQKRLLQRPAICIPAIALSLALVGSACTNSATSKADPNDGEVVLLSGELELVYSCDALVDRIKEDALQRVGPYGLDQPDIDGTTGPGPTAITESEGEVVEDAESDAVEEDGASDEDRSSDAGEEPSAPESGKDTSGTNNQEDGVDEADIVKSDGKTLAMVIGSELRVLDVSGDTPRLTKTISLSQLGQATGMFLNGDRLVLLSVDDTGRGQPISLLTEIDLDTGQVGGSAEFEGRYVSSREVDGTLRLVMKSTVENLRFVTPDGRTDEGQAEEENREIVERSTIEDWLAEYRITGTDDRQSSQQLVDCNQVHLPQNFSGGGQVSVVTVEIDNPLAIIDSLAVHTDAQTVYASTDRLVVAVPQWPVLEDPDDRRSFASPYSTALHSFDTSDPDRTSYVASGSVRGLLLNQFSLSEHEGNLRVATTDQAGESESFVSVLSENGDSLEVIGEVGGLGRGERIFAVRFIGDIGYVVTFRETDPLYTIDLTDPSNPSMLGELKIPGFSNYLHEVDGRTLLGVGSDGTDDGQILGAAVSLFDVEDLSDPTRLDKITFNFDTWTPVAEDAKAFTFWKKTNTAIVPIVSYSGPVLSDQPDPNAPPSEEGPMVSEAVVINIDPEMGRMETQGTINHQSLCGRSSGASTNPDRRVPRGQEESDDVRPTNPPDTTTEPAEPVADEDEWACAKRTQINRTMVIGEDIFTFSDAGIMVHDLDELNPVAQIPFN